METHRNLCNAPNGTSVSAQIRRMRRARRIAHSQAQRAYALQLSAAIAALVATATAFLIVTAPMPHAAAPMPTIAPTPYAAAPNLTAPMPYITHHA